jgi:hypothetical protein
VVHGLHSNYRKTWLGETGDKPVIRALLREVPSARVFAYNGELKFSSDDNLLDPSALERAAVSLLAEITNRVARKVGDEFTGIGWGVWDQAECALWLTSFPAAHCLSLPQRWRHSCQRGRLSCPELGK